jgi:hypothetical protein
VFVVVLAITLLTAVGLFAAHSATLADQAAGYQRLARQTQQLAEYGLLAGAAELGSGAAGAHVAQLHETGHFCAANADREDLASAPCYRRSLAELSARTKELSSESMTKDQTGTLEDVLGNGKTQGQFVVEFTDPSTNVRVAGSDYGSGSPTKYTYVKVTATTFAQLHATGVAGCTDDVATLSGQQAVRAHVVVGPVLEN